MLQISDIHGKEFGINQQEIIEKLEYESVDLIVFTGDYINRANRDSLEDLDATISLINALKEKYSKTSIYYILGSWDIPHQ